MMKMSRHVAIAACVLVTAACAKGPDLDAVEVGQDVAVTRADGGVVQGTVTGRNEQNVEVTAGRTTRSIRRRDIVDVRMVDAGTPVVLPAAATFREYTVPQGTSLSLRLTSAIDSATSRVGDQVDATLAEAVSIGGVEVWPAGSVLTGAVSAVERSAKVRGLASISLRFTALSVAGRDDRYDIDGTYSETADATKTEDAAKIGIGAGAGAVIGGILGGKGGAAKGAVIGGGAGTAVVLETAGDEVQHAVGATLTATLRGDVDVQVPIE